MPQNQDSLACYARKAGIVAWYAMDTGNCGISLRKHKIVGFPVYTMHGKAYYSFIGCKRRRQGGNAAPVGEKGESRRSLTI